jgi:hypothetical protein
MFLLEKEELYDTLLEHLRISKAEIDDHYESNSAILAFWAAKYEYEKFSFQRNKRKFERFQAQRYMEVKSSLGARVTETQVKQKLLSDSELNKKQDVMDLQEFKVGLLKAIVDVIHDRNSNVISLGASARRERNTFDSTKVRERKDKLRNVFKKGR